MSSQPFPESVWVIARLVPPGRVVSYGDIAALLGVNPRHVGRAMSQCGDPDVPWWRVVNAGGRLPQPLLDQALDQWRGEATPTRLDGSGVVMSRARADLAALADAAESQLGRLPGLA